MGVGGYLVGALSEWALGGRWRTEVDPPDRSGRRPIEVGVDRKMGGGALFFQ